MTSSIISQIRSAFKIYQDFPEPGISFWDMNSLLSNPVLRQKAWSIMTNQVSSLQANVVVGLESRGFLTASELSTRLGHQLVLARKPNKLPGERYSVTYYKEYKNQDGEPSQSSDPTNPLGRPNTMEIMKASIRRNHRVIISDDLLATGGSVLSVVDLVRQSGAEVVGVSVLVELCELNARAKLLEHGIQLFSLIQVYSAHTSPHTDCSQCCFCNSQDHPCLEPDGSNAHRMYVPNDTVKSNDMDGILTLQQIHAHQMIGCSHPSRMDDRIVLLYSPVMQTMANSIALRFPHMFRMVSIQWDHFPDGSPNIDFYSDKYMTNRDVLFLGSLEEGAPLLDQVSLLIALPRQAVRSLTICFPYYNTGTHELVSREGILATAEPMAKIISNSLEMTCNGLPVLQMFDIHNLTTRFYFGKQVQPRMLSAVPMLKNKIREWEEELDNKMVLCFPDQGAQKRFTELFRDMEHNPRIVLGKKRDGTKRILHVVQGLSELMSPLVSHILIVDDLVQSGATLYESFKLLTQLYPLAKISAYVTHAVFPEQGWVHFLPDGKYAGLERFYVTNTISRSVRHLIGQAPFEVLDVSDTIVNDLAVRLGGESQSPIPALTVYVASKNVDKIRSARKAIERTLPGLNYVLEGHECDSQVPSQPIGGQAFEGALNRLNALPVVVPKDVPGSGGDHVLQIAFENGMFKDVCGGEVGHTDACVSLVRYTGFPIVFSSLSPKVSVPNVVYDEAISNRQTVGEVLEKKCGWNKSNWHAHFDVQGRDRIDLMTISIQRAIYEMLNTAPVGVSVGNRGQLASCL